MDTPKPRFTDEGRRLYVDMTFARIEDAIATLRKDAPLNAAEGAHAAELAQELVDLANKAEAE